jgi:hypothetical protein
LVGNISRSFAEAINQSDLRRKNAELWGTRCTQIAWPHKWLALPWDWRARALSWRLQRVGHPHPRDTRLSIWRGLNESLAQWPGYTMVERCVQRAWVAFMLVAPLRWVSALASTNVSGGARSGLKRLRRAKGAA